MNGYNKRNSANDWREVIINAAVWVATFGGAVLWAGLVFKKNTSFDYVLAPTYLSISILVADWILMWGTDAQRLRQVIDRRIVLGLVGLSFFFLDWSNDFLLSEITLGREHLLSLALSGLTLGAAQFLLILLAIKGKDWHLAGSLGNEQTLGNWNDDSSSEVVSLLYAYPIRLAGQPKSLWRTCLACILAVATSFFLYLMGDLIAFVALAAIVMGFLSFLQHMFSFGLFNKCRDLNISKKSRK